MPTPRTGIAMFRRALSSIPAIASLLLLAALLLPAFAHAQDADADRQRDPIRTRKTVTLKGEPLAPAATAIVNFGELARAEAFRAKPLIPVRVRDLENNEEAGDGAEPEGLVTGSPFVDALLAKPIAPFAASPAPAQTFAGLDDIPMADSLYIVIPPDISGAVGLTKVMQGSNNNYRILDKTTGAVLATLGTATFWAPVVSVSERASLTDPRMAYDPYNNRWIAVMQTTTASAGKILIAVSQTSDPQGAWFQYSFNTASTVDFPILGFNKNWISVSINKYNAAGSAFSSGINLVMNYPLARTGTSGVTLFTLTNGTGFCVSPCLTYSTTTDTLYAVAHLSSTGATYALDKITGTAAAPVYTQGGTLTRTGGGWAQPSGNKLPQSAPNSGTSACGTTPCTIEVQDSYVRSAPVFRGGQIWYAQTVGLPSSGLTHMAAQWTRITTPSGAFVDGGRLEDPTATATNGGKWYSDVHLAVNNNGDMLLGFSQFSSAQHPSAGYAVRLAGDAAGTIRDAQIYRAGDDYYHKTFSTATGRNRWGDFSTTQVDPSDDNTMWALQEYGKTRATTDDGNTGSNASKWGTWWAKVSTTSYTITASAGPNGGISPSGAVVVPSGGSQSFSITPAANYHVADVLVDGSSVGAVTNYNFTNVTANHTISASYAINTFTITASAGANGTIAPAGLTTLNAGGSQSYTITPDPGYHVADVLVDIVSVGAVTNYAFTNVTASHTINASFAIDQFNIVASAGAGGSVTPSGTTVVNRGASQAYTVTPNANFHIVDVLVDGGSVGAVTGFNFTNVTANHTISASFAADVWTITASAGANGSITPSGVVNVNGGTNRSFAITPAPSYHVADVLVDGSSVGAVTTYNFTNVTANHTIDASFAIDTYTITASAGAHGSIAPSGAMGVNSGGSQAFTITPNPAYHVADVLVDGGSVGAVTGYTFTNVTANHTISASFAIDRFAVAITTAGSGVVLKSPDQPLYDFGTPLSLTAQPASGFVFLGWSGDTTTTSDPLDVVVTRALAYTATFADTLAPSVTVTTPNNGEAYGVGTVAPFAWTATDGAGVTNVTLRLSRDGGATFDTLAAGLANTGNYAWTVTGPVTDLARLEVIARDAAGNAGSDVSDENFIIDATTSVAGGPVTEFALGAVVPNPARGVAHVTFALPRAASVHVGVLDVQGREVMTLADGEFAPGRHQAALAMGRSLSPGLYFVRMTAPGHRFVSRFVVMQ